MFKNSIQKSALILGLMLAPTSVFAQTTPSDSDIKGTDLNLKMPKLPDLSDWFYRGRVVDQLGRVRVEVGTNDGHNGSTAFQYQNRLYWGTNDRANEESGILPLTIQASGLIENQSSTGDRSKLEASVISAAYSRSSFDSTLSDSPGVWAVQFLTPELYVNKNDYFGINESGLRINVLRFGLRGAIGVGKEPSAAERKNGKLNQIELAAQLDPMVIYATGPSAKQNSQRLTLEAGLRLADVANFKNIFSCTDGDGKRGTLVELGEFAYEFRADQIANSPFGVFVQHINQFSTEGNLSRKITRVGASANF